MLPRDVTSVLESAGGADFVYGDSLHFDPSEAGRFRHVLRPGWSPERLLSHCYVGDVVAVKSELVAVAGRRQLLEDLSPHERALRLAGVSRSHARAARILSAAVGFPTPPGFDVGAVQAVLDEAGIEAECTLAANGASVRVTRRVEGSPKVSVIIPTRGTRAVIGGAERVLVVEAVRQMTERLTHTNLEFVVVTDSDTPGNVVDSLRSICGERLTVVAHEGPFNFARKINSGVVRSTADYLLFVNDDIEIESTNVVETLLSHLRDPDVGMVAPLLEFGDGTVQSAGHILNPAPFDLYRGFPVDLPGGDGILRAARETSSVIAAFAMTRRSDFESVGGMCEGFPGNYNDVDYCLKLGLLGKRTIITPHARCIHFESKTRVAVPDPVATDRLRSRWDRLLRADPYGNPMLQPWEFVWKTNVDTAESLGDAFGVGVKWDSWRWFLLNTRDDRFLHRTRYYPRWTRLNE